LFWRGIYDFIFLIILASATILPGFVKFYYYERFNSGRGLLNQVVLKLLFTFFSFFKAFCLLKILDTFSPQHVAFCNTAFSLYLLVKSRLKSEDNLFLMLLDAIFLVLIIFATLIFNEIIIINAFGLNKNTKKSFLKKEKVELQSIKNNDNDDSGSNDDEDDKEDKEEVLDIKNENINFFTFS
jgi:hypothetical protein